MFRVYIIYDIKEVLVMLTNTLNIQLDISYVINKLSMIVAIVPITESNTTRKCCPGSAVVSLKKPIAS